MLTILKTSEEGGLQIYHDNEWIDVSPPEDGFIINLGKGSPFPMRDLG